MGGHVSGDAMRYFLALTEERNFTRAAARLRISTPSLSQQIQRVEASVGRVLFERSARGVRLTEAGEELVPLAEAVVRAHDAVRRWAERRDDRASALRVGVVAAGAGELTTRILTEFLRVSEGVRLELVRLGFIEAIDAVRDGTVEVAFAVAPLPHHPAVSSRVVAYEPRVLVLRQDHPLAARATIDVDESNALGFVVAAGTEGELRDWWVVDPRPDGTRPRVTGTADDIEGLIELCAAGVGVNIATQSASTHFGRPGLAYVPIRDIAPAEIVFLRRSETTDPAVRLFDAVVAALSVSGDPQPGT